mmetsp:Transcript_22142/g.58686  ORF Transcript_22142/g.58686 Transcript_22142/m.58686 type:complete len:289 (-) Transcript_22142:3114-3980(-)
MNTLRRPRLKQRLRQRAFHVTRHFGGSADLGPKLFFGALASWTSVANSVTRPQPFVRPPVELVIHSLAKTRLDDHWSTRRRWRALAFPFARRAFARGSRARWTVTSIRRNFCGCCCLNFGSICGTLRFALGWRTFAPGRSLARRALPRRALPRCAIFLLCTRGTILVRRCRLHRFVVQDGSGTPRCLAWTATVGKLLPPHIFFLRRGLWIGFFESPEHLQVFAGYWLVLTECWHQDFFFHLLCLVENHVTRNEQIVPRQAEVTAFHASNFEPSKELLIFVFGTVLQLH